jgi:hypothetical protein
MSRSGYSEDCEHIALWCGAVDRATFGVRGQAFMRKLRDALDAMPVKRLITDAVRNEAGEVCALGAVDATVELYDAEDLARHFGIARALAAEIVYRNDEDCSWQRAHHVFETPEERWIRMRAWVAKQIGPDETPKGEPA